VLWWCRQPRIAADQTFKLGQSTQYLHRDLTMIATLLLQRGQRTSLGLEEHTNPVEDLQYPAMGPGRCRVIAGASKGRLPLPFP
jgi:hypothetical protein